MRSAVRCAKKTEKNNFRGFISFHSRDFFQCRGNGMQNISISFTHLDHKFILWSAQGKQVKRQLFIFTYMLSKLFVNNVFRFYLVAKMYWNIFENFSVIGAFLKIIAFENIESFQYINTFTSSVRPWKTKALNIKQLCEKLYHYMISLQYTLRVSLYIRFFIFFHFNEGRKFFTAL